MWPDCILSPTSTNDWIETENMNDNVNNVFSVLLMLVASAITGTSGPNCFLLYVNAAPTATDTDLFETLT